MNNKIKTVALILIIALITVGIVYAVDYVLQTSTPVDVAVTSGTVYIPVVLTTSSTNMPDTDALTLTATVTDANGLGKTVNFYDGAAIVGTAAIANVGGVYKATVTLPALSLTAGIHTFTAGP